MNTKDMLENLGSSQNGKKDEVLPEVIPAQHKEKASPVQPNNSNVSEDMTKLIRNIIPTL